MKRWMVRWIFDYYFIFIYSFFLEGHGFMVAYSCEWGADSKRKGGGCVYKRGEEEEKSMEDGVSEGVRRRMRVTPSFLRYDYCL